MNQELTQCCRFWYVGPVQVQDALEGISVCCLYLSIGQLNISRQNQFTDEDLGLELTGSQLMKSR
jgi:hypothetical protein